jgi:outer membrane protein assembly factor BamB
MRASAGRSTRFGQRRALSRAVAVIATAGWIVVMAVNGGAVASASSGTPAAAQAALPASFWAAYLNGPLHTSYSPSQTSITPANATALVQKWSQTLVGVPYIASPTVVRGSVYIGGADGSFYRLDVHTGQVLAKVNMGSPPAPPCGSTAVSSTATVARDPRTHALTVYVAGADGYLYALQATTLAREWRSVIALPSKVVSDYRDWSSPTLANGKIYIGVASSCDRPLVRGAVMAFSQATGAKLAELYTVPAGARGASVWSSIAVAPNGDVFATTGNGPRGRPFLRDSESILKLNPDTLALLGKYQVPAADVIGDGDFGASPVIFGNDVGACNKNGIFYAVRQSTMKLAWKQRIGHAAGQPGGGTCLAAPVYDGKHLYFGGNETTLAGQANPVPGSVQERSPSTGALIWATALPGGVLGSPTMDGAGVIAVATDYSTTTGVYLVSAATGAILKQLLPDGAFAQSVFAEGRLFGATSTGVYAWGLLGG